MIQYTTECERCHEPRVLRRSVAVCPKCEEDDRVAKVIAKEAEADEFNGPLPGAVWPRVTRCACRQPGCGGARDPQAQVDALRRAEEREREDEGRAEPSDLVYIEDAMDGRSQ